MSPDSIGGWEGGFQGSHFLGCEMGEWATTAMIPPLREEAIGLGDSWSIWGIPLGVMQGSRVWCRVGRNEREYGRSRSLLFYFMKVLIVGWTTRLYWVGVGSAFFGRRTGVGGTEAGSWMWEILGVSLVCYTFFNFCVSIFFVFYCKLLGAFSANYGFL